MVGSPYGARVKERLNHVQIDLIHDTRHLCTRLRTDGIKIMSRGFSGGKQTIKFANARNRGRVCLIQRTENEELFILRQIIGGNDHCYFLLLATVNVLTASYNDVLKTCRNSKCTFCMTIKSSSRLERINKLERDNSYWQILSLVCPLKYHLTLLYSHQS